jgi:hypothetical protein
MNMSELGAMEQFGVFFGVSMVLFVVMMLAVSRNQPEE